MPLNAYAFFTCTYCQNSTHTTRTRARTHTHTHSEGETDRQTDRQTDRDRDRETERQRQRQRVVYQGNGTEEMISKRRKVFKEDLKQLTEVE